MCLSVTNCCCCISLDVGTKVVGVFSTLLAVILTAVFGWSALLGAELPVSRQWFYGAMAAVGLMQSVFGCLLVYGAFTHKARYTVPWAALAWSQAMVLAALTVAATVLLSYNRGQQTTAAISTVVSVYFIYALLLYYFASVVNSRRQQMLVDDQTQASKRLMRHRVLPDFYV